MTPLGATLESVDAGFVEIQRPISPAVAQQHGFVHAGAVASIGDSAFESLNQLSLACQLQYAAR